MNPKALLRPAVESDVPAIRRLIRGLAEYERMLPEATATEMDYRQALFGPLPRAQAILAEIDGTSIGLALFYFTFNTFKATVNMFLEDLFVASEHRGTGVGIALMRALAQRAVAEDCGRIEWRVLNWNQPAIDFYQRIGAQPVDRWHTRQLGGAALVALAKGTSDG